MALRHAKAPRDLPGWDAESVAFTFCVLAIVLFVALLIVLGARAVRASERAEFAPVTVDKFGRVVVVEEVQP